MHWKYFALWFLLTFSVHAKNDSIIVDLKNPEFSEKIMRTQEGGVIESQNFWMQSKIIQYERNTNPGSEINKVLAQDLLRLDYYGQVFIGDKLEYDFIAKRGVIYNGRTQSGIFYISGQKIYLEPDGTFRIITANLTTCEEKDRGWKVKAHYLTITGQRYVRAKDVSFRVNKFPVFWLPQLKATLHSLAKSPWEFQFSLRSMGGRRVTAKYLIYAWKEFEAHFRLDYLLNRGFGGGLEMEYKGNNTLFISRSYVARDRLIDNPKNHRRYRVEGVYSYESPDDRYYINLSYDRLSDSEMASDYPRETFNEQTPKPTQFFASIKDDPAVVSVFTNVRWNPFQTLKEELPSFIIHSRPLGLTSFGPYIQSNFCLAYLNYHYATQWKGILPNFQSMRVFFDPKLFIGFHLGPLLFNPQATYLVLLYSNSPSGQNEFVGLFNLSSKVELPLFRKYSNFWHGITPYIQVNRYTTPTINLSNRFIFDTTDGYTRLDYFQIGFQNRFFQPNKYYAYSLLIDAFIQGFWDVKAFVKRYPRCGLELHWQLPNLYFQLRGIYNIQNETVDRIDLHLRWTISADLAIALEFQHRSLFDWRKADYNSYFLEAARTQEDLLSSPLSAKSDTLLTHIYYRFSPIWSIAVESRHGWQRTDGPTFNDFKIDVIRFLSCNLKCKISIQHTRAVNFKAMFFLTIDKKPLRPKFRLREFKP